jgi:hypothetical protein
MGFELQRPQFVWHRRTSSSKELGETTAGCEKIQVLHFGMMMIQ